MKTSEVLLEIRRAINKGWWDHFNIYKLHDKPLSEILSAIDRAIALAEADKPNDRLRLDALLEDFRGAMLRKFIKRRDTAIKRWGSSVTDPDFDWDNLNPEDIQTHMLEEMQEWTEDDGENRLTEDVDIANMAFLDWVFRRGTK